MRRRAPCWVAALALAVAASEPSVAFEKRAVPIASFFRPPEVQGVSLNADGRFFVSFVRLGSTREVRVHRRASSEHSVALVTDTEVDVRIFWVGRDRFVISSGRRDGAKWTAEVVVVADEGEDVIRERYWIASRGWVLHGLPDEDGFALFERGDSIYRIDVRAFSAKEAVDEWLSPAHRVTELPAGSVLVVVDRDGDVRGALTIERSGDEDIDYRIHHRPRGSSSWSEALSWTQDDKFFVRPLGFTADGARLLVASDRERDRAALVELDPETGSEGAVMFEHPTAELTALEYDHGGHTLVGVQYREAGEHRMHYFADAFAAERARIAERLPGRTIRVRSTNADNSAIGFFAYADTDTGGFFLYDAETDTVREVGRVSTLLDSIEFGPTRRFVVRAEGGPEVEAFFTEPARVEKVRAHWEERVEPGKPPLVVVPHGGPIGVRDDVGFDPMVRLLAYYGYAVLQVNYRGSSGFGRAFREAGFGQMGTGIEDDVDAAFDHVIAQGWVDASRVATIGGSYGGYSSLMSAIRHPERFRCVVTLFGVTDLPLLFDNPNARLYDGTYEYVRRVAGDPTTDFDDLVHRSPVYRAADLEVPVFIVHGAKDVNVDVDHAYRLRVALARLGKPYRFRILRNLDHSYGGPKTAESIFGDVLRFLDEHMGPKATPR